MEHKNPAVWLRTEEGDDEGSPFVRSVDVKSPLDDGGPLQTADDEGVWLGPLRLHQLTFWTSQRGRETLGVTLTFVLSLQHVS